MYWCMLLWLMLSRYNVNPGIVWDDGTWWHAVFHPISAKRLMGLLDVDCFNQFNHHFPILTLFFLWFSHEFSMILHDFPHNFPRFSQVFPWFSHDFPRFSHGFPMVFPWFSQISPWFSHGFRLTSPQEALPVPRWHDAHGSHGSSGALVALGAVRGALKGPPSVRCGRGWG